MSLLNIKNLKTDFKTDDGIVQAVRGISFKVEKGETVGIVGESGCGKSVTMLSVMGLNERNATMQADEVSFDGAELSGLSKEAMRAVLGKDIGMIFQDPMTSLNPLFTIGNQICEPLMKHLNLSKKEARERAVKLLNMVQIPSPESRLKQYPHEFSGGMRQRVMIAIAMSCRPKLLIADEPTTALDMTIQAQILELMNRLKDKNDMSIILITHDLGVVVNMCTRVMVMYAGLIVEEGTVEEIFYEPKHPYTWGLINSLPKIEGARKEKLVPIPGSPPDLIQPPMGCPFVDRCDYAMRICKEYMPRATSLSTTHESACWLLQKDGGGLQA